MRGAHSHVRMEFGFVLILIGLRRAHNDPAKRVPNETDSPKRGPWAVVLNKVFYFICQVTAHGLYVPLCRAFVFMGAIQQKLRPN